MDGVTLIRGDCLKVLRRLESGSVDLIFTDPPYGHNNQENDLQAARVRDDVKGARKRPVVTIANDGPEANGLFRSFLIQAKRLLASCCCCCCCCCCCAGGGPDPQFARWSLWMDEALRFKQMVVWDKGGIGMGWHYRRSTECVLVAQKGKGRCNWFDTSRRVENIIRPGDYGIKKIIPRADQHPTEKPVALAAHFIRLHSKPGDLVLDPFMGSGTTGVACLETGRNFIGIELDPVYFRMAKKRLAAARKEKAA
jgi:site-specific DNA-methyltransferase (adenine-specific)